MDYDVSVSENGNYIIIKVNVPMTNALGVRCGTDAKALGDQRGIERFLFDSRGAPNIESVTANYQFAYEDIGNFEFPRLARSALLVDPDDHSLDFMETVFLNAGYNVKLFSDEKEAIGWLNR